MEPIVIDLESAARVVNAQLEGRAFRPRDLAESALFTRKVLAHNRDRAGGVFVKRQGTYDAAIVILGDSAPSRIKEFCNCTNCIPRLTQKVNALKSVFQK